MAVAVTVTTVATVTELAHAGTRFAREGRTGSLRSMHVTRVGLAPVKGTRHHELPVVDLDPQGPVGDRVFCLVDIRSGRVVRTVDHPRLTLVDATWDGTTLTARTPDGREVTTTPEPTGELLELDYWGRGARVELLGSPHAQLLGDHLGREVHLARVKPGEVVYGSAVSLVTTGEIAALGESDSGRFRATFTIDADRSPTPGTEITLGEATIRVRAPMPRCRVIDINTTTGEMDRRHLATLADWPRATGELWFGVDAEVLTPGRVRRGDPVTTRHAAPAAAP